MVREILQIGNQLLTTKSKVVPTADISGPEIQQLISDMLDTCRFHDKDTAGLSAVQIGKLLRIFIARRIDIDEEQWDVFINPEMKVIDPKPVTMWEGCMSIGEGDDRLFGPVDRPRKVEVAYLDEKGESRSLVAEDYMSHIIQHEMDHLDGKLFLQYITDPSLIWRNADLDDYITANGHYPDN